MKNLVLTLLLVTAPLVANAEDWWLRCAPLNAAADKIPTAIKNADTGKCMAGYSPIRPAAPFVVVWDRLSASEKSKIRSFGVAPEGE